MAPLTGVRVIEIAALAPVPFAAMILSDLGADVVRVDRVGHPEAGEGMSPANPLNRGRRSVAVDLKSAEGLDTLLRLLEGADVIIEGFRPGVAERLGFGPDVALARNPRLVFGRMTGWGQYGPLSHTAGHDINYIAIGGGLGLIRDSDGRPVPPLNLLGDFAGGGLTLALGICAALLERAGSGKGQVVDAGMSDGTAMLTAFIHGMRNDGEWDGEVGTNLLCGSAPYYTTYATSDGEYMCVGPGEPKFYAQMVTGLGLTEADLPAQHDRARWPELKARLGEEFAKRTRDEWTKIFEDTDACVSPVLSLDEAIAHPHNVARGTFVEVQGHPQPAPAPRFSRTPSEAARTVAAVGEHTTEILAEIGLSAREISRLVELGAVR